MTDLSFNEVYERYFKDIYLYAKAISGDGAVAEEIAAETFFKALRSLDRYRGDCDIRVWLCQIAKNTYYTYCKKRKRLAPLPETAPAEDFRLDERLSDKEDAFAIHQFLHAMEEPYKEVFSLRVFGELPFAQIAAIFGKSESWARVTYHRAKGKIIEFMEGRS